MDVIADSCHKLLNPRYRNSLIKLDNGKGVLECEKKASALRQELKELKRIENVLTKRMLFSGIFSEALKPEDITPVVVGGNAVEYYSAGGYATGDNDSVVPHEALGSVLKA